MAAPHPFDKPEMLDQAPEVVEVDILPSWKSCENQSREEEIFLPIAPPLILSPQPSGRSQLEQQYPPAAAWGNNRGWLWFLSIGELHARVHDPVTATRFVNKGCFVPRDLD